MLKIITGQMGGKSANPYCIKLEDRKYWRLQPRKNVSSSTDFSIREQVLSQFMDYTLEPHGTSGTIYMNVVCRFYVHQAERLSFSLVFLQQLAHVYMRHQEVLDNEISEGHEIILLTVLIVREIFYLNVYCIGFITV